MTLKKVGKGWRDTVRAGVYPEDHERAGEDIQFRLTLETESEPHAKACWARLMVMRNALVKSKRGLEAEHILRQAAMHVDEPQLFNAALQVASLVDQLPAVAPDSQGWDTWGKVADAWTSGRLRARYPGKNIPDKDSTKDEGIVDKLRPFIGDVPLDAFTEGHYDIAMANLPARVKSDLSRRHYSQVILRVMNLAKKCKLTRVWHLDGVEVIKPDKRKLPTFTCLYPENIAALLPAERIDIEWRVLWGFMLFESPRIGKLRELRWGDIATAGTGMVKMDSKTGEFLQWALRPGTLPALLHIKALRPELSGPFAWMSDAEQAQAAKILRRHLASVGQHDPRLQETKGRQRKLRAHDLRATFVVFAKLEGQSESWIMDRTGHTTSEMVQRYDRLARATKGSGWQPLGRLDEALGIAAGSPSPEGPEGSRVQVSDPMGPGPDAAPEAPETASVERPGAERAEAERGAEPRAAAPTVTPTVTPRILRQDPAAEGAAQTMEITRATHENPQFRRQESNLDQRIQRPTNTNESAQNVDGSIDRDTPEATRSDQLSRSAVTPRAAYAVALKHAMHAAIEAESFADVADLARLVAAATAAAGGAKVVDLALRRGQG